MRAFYITVSAVFITLCGYAQRPQLILNADKANKSASACLYGLMTEEINHSYDGGLYGELIRNRIFKDNPNKPEGWNLIQTDQGKGAIQLVGADPLNVPRDQRGNAINDALTTCLKLTVESNLGFVGISNTGYWGIPVRSGKTYNASFYLKTSDEADGPLTVSIQKNDGSIIYATGQINPERGGWRKYSLQLTIKQNVQPTADARFVISTGHKGLYWFNLVSLFPPTYNNRVNGNRVDIMKMLADMKPAFLRFPGGNFLEGDYFGSRFDWKNTLGPLEQRPGHQGCWSYRASDGMGLLEFLEWCEDLKMEPLLAVYAGYSLQGDHVEPGVLLKPYVNDALDEIEYVTGDVNTKWGAIRARDGHPKPFKLKYIEIGNEDWFDKSYSYDKRYTQFKIAINAKYPLLNCISTIEDFHKGKVVSCKPDMIDEHFYRTAWQMEEDADHYDKYDRSKSPKIFVGEWATREGAPTTNMNAALGDAAWMTGMERNSDLVLRSCYAPLFVNVNEKSDEYPRAWQWDSDLIGYNALTSYGSPSYYAQKMFNNHLGDKIVPISGINIPLKQAMHSDSLNKREFPKKKSIPSLFFVATLSTSKDEMYLKLVNTSGQPQTVDLKILSKRHVLPSGELIVLKSEHPEDTNDIKNPKNIVPVTMQINDISNSFSRTFDPYSINVLVLKLAKSH